MKKQVSTILNQLLDFIPKNKFDNFVGQHKADKYTKRLSCWQQLITLLYAQATGKDSLREIETWLSLHNNKWYHLWLETVARSTLSDANNKRPYQIYESLFYELLSECKHLWVWLGEKEFSFNNPLYSLDATVINLCLTVFPWAKYRKRKWALKLHVLLNNKTCIPEFIDWSPWKKHEIKIAQEKEYFGLEPESILTIDRWYVDFKWFNTLNSNGIYFVTRIKNNTNFWVLEKYPITENNIISDEKVFLSINWKNEDYKEDVRIIRYYDKTKNKIYQYITNNFELSAKTIADIYKNRWEIELFFKWIKQNLKIKSFLWVSSNAVLTQIWIAMIYYLILCFIKFKARVKMSLLEFTRVIRELILERTSLISILNIPIKKIYICKQRDWPQLTIF